VGVLAMGISAQPTFGASSVIFYLLGYSMMTLGTFAIVSMMERTENHSVGIDDLAGLAKRRPLISLCLTLLLLSLAGIPPTLGFFGKFYLFSGALKEGLVWLALWGVINSVISVYYYLRPIVLMYMTEGEGEVAGHPLSATTVTVVLSALLIGLLGFFSGPIFMAVESSL
jgi:NADH-quinone oxidoreductase subunit N